MTKNTRRIYIILVLTAGLYPGALKAQTVDASTMRYKVMAGYQGWFRTPGDTPDNQGWAHLFKTSSPSPEKLAFDTWPDMSEMSEKEKYPAPGFTYADGRQAYLYSAQNYQTVLRHFQWMRNYDIDGVWLSEFCGHFPGGGSQYDSTAVLHIMQNVRKAAKETGRTWAFMWDMSGFGRQMSKESVYAIITNQWKKMVEEGVTSDDRYLHENGKPVLLIWGFFPGRPASQPDYMNPVIDFLQAKGKYQATLIAGVDPNWRALGTPEFQSMLMRMQGLQPWSVGRRVTDPSTGYAVQNTSAWSEDIRMCEANHVMFMPVLNAGTHIAGPPPPNHVPTVPRRTGNYLWEQYVVASKFHLNSAFLAMFDEINEGTQMMKIDINPPVQAPFFTYDGATSDYYLRLAGAGARLLRENKPIDPVIPVNPFDPQKWYHIRNQANGMLLTAGNAQLLTASLKDGDNHQLWQIEMAGAGIFCFKNKYDGRVLWIDHANAQLTKPQKNVAWPVSMEWRLEWDGSGACRIIAKNSSQAICIASKEEYGVVVSGDKPLDEYRWQIIPQ